MVSVFVLIAGMLGATFLLRPYFMQSMALHPAAYVANGIGLIVGAAANLLWPQLSRKFQRTLITASWVLAWLGGR